MNEKKRIASSFVYDDLCDSPPQSQFLYCLYLCIYDFMPYQHEIMRIFITLLLEFKLYFVIPDYFYYGIFYKTMAKLYTKSNINVSFL